MRAILTLPGATPGTVQTDGREDLIVAVDGGADVLAALGVRPRLLVGDMDSVKAETLARFEAAGVEILRRPARKDHTDAQIALEEAIRRGAGEIIFHGLSGGRWDHEFANLQLVHRAVHLGVRVRAVEADAELWGVSPDHPLAIALPEGSLVTVLPLTSRAEGVTLEGFDWPLDGALMEFGNPYGVSNLTRGPSQRVTCDAGALAVFHCFNKDPRRSGP